MTKRLAIYMTYNNEGIIDDYIVYMIEALKKVCQDIIVVSNNLLPERQKNKLSEASRIYERDNKGYDAGAYSEVIMKLYANKELEEYDELLLLNDSVFGPFYDLNDMFKEMDNRSPAVDFWGITRRGCSDFDGGDTIYPEHIQSYCYIFRKRLLHSNDFIEYWEGIIDKITDFRSAITNYEFQLTRHFSELGYTWDSYCRCKEFISENPNNNLSPYHYESYELIKNEKCPFLKRKLFTGDFIENKYANASDLKRAFNYIKDNTSYNVDMIWEYILREYDMFQIIKSMQLFEVIESSACMCGSDKVDVIDVYENVIDELYTKNQLDNEYVICFAVKDSIELVSLRRSYIYNVIANLYYSGDYVASLVNTFEKDERLGILLPPMDMYGKISNSLGGKIHKVHGFMCRKELLSPEISEKIKKNGMDNVVAQLIFDAKNRGYYTKIVVNKGYVSTWMTNSLVVSSRLYKLYDDGNDNEADVDQLYDIYYKEKVSEFIRRNKYVYLYGAGQLACRVVDLISDKSCIKGIIVSDINGNCRNIKGIPVIQFDDFYDNKCGVIVAVGEKNNHIIKKRLEQAGIDKYMLLK